MGSHHQKLVVLRHDEDPSKDVAFVGGIDLCYGRRDDADHGGDPQSLPMADGVRDRTAVARRAAGDPRPGRARARHRLPRAVGRPQQPRRGPPDRLDPRQAAPHPAARRPAAAAAAAAAGVRAALRADPAHLSGDPAAVRLRPGRRAVGGAGLHEGDQAGPAADLPRGPVHVVGRRGPAVRRGADRQPRAAPGRRRAALPRPGRRLRGATGARRPLAGDRDVPQGRSGTGCTSSTSRTTPARRSTCTRRSASPTTRGPAWAATTSTGARGRTTASSPARCWTRPATRGSRWTPAGRARAPAPSPGTCAWRWPASTSISPTTAAEDDEILDPARFVASLNASVPTRWTPGTRAAGRAPGPPGRLRPHRRRAAAAPHPAVGDPGLPPARRPRRPAAADAAEEDLLTRAARDAAPPITVTSRARPPRGQTHSDSVEARALPASVGRARSGRARAFLPGPVVLCSATCGQSTTVHRCHGSSEPVTPRFRTAARLDRVEHIRPARSAAPDPPAGRPVAAGARAAAGSVRPRSGRPRPADGTSPSVSSSGLAAWPAFGWRCWTRQAEEVARDVAGRRSGRREPAVPGAPRHPVQRRGLVARPPPVRPRTALVHVRPRPRDKGPVPPPGRHARRPPAPPARRLACRAGRGPATRASAGPRRGPASGAFLAGEFRHSTTAFTCSCPPACDELDDRSGKPVHAPGCACDCDVA